MEIPFDDACHQYPILSTYRSDRKRVHFYFDDEDLLPNADERLEKVLGSLKEEAQYIQKNGDILKNDDNSLVDFLVLNACSPTWLDLSEITKYVNTVLNHPMSDMAVSSYLNDLHEKTLAYLERKKGIVHYARKRRRWDFVDYYKSVYGFRTVDIGKEWVASIRRDIPTTDRW